MKNFFKIIITTIVFFTAVSFAQAQVNPFNIEFPIAELGSCNSVEECKVYCDDPTNVDACIAWAEAEGIIEPPEDNKGGLIGGGKGPGGCDSPGSCDAFCSQSENQEECFTFAKEHDLIAPEEVKRIEDFKEKEIRTGPGGCSSREECDTFCRNPDNSETCLLFAVDEGNLTEEEAGFLLKRMEAHKEFDGPRGPRGPRGPGPVSPEPTDIDKEKAKELLETIGGPGGCSTFDECDVFCSTPGNDEVCMNFAIDHNLVPEKEIERMKKMIDLEGPGGCRGRECEEYCGNEDHAEECFAFAIENELMSPEEEFQGRKFVEIAQKGGPGGCKGQRECDEYCGNPEHGEECFAFAKEHDLFQPGELEMVERERKIMKKLESGNGGPGGCSGSQECEEYCSNPDNTNECMNFAVDSGMMEPQKMDEMKRMMQEFERFGKPEGFGRGQSSDDFGRGADGFEPPRGDLKSPEDFDRENFDGDLKRGFGVFDKNSERFKDDDFPPRDEFRGNRGEDGGDRNFPHERDFSDSSKFPEGFQVPPEFTEGGVPEEFRDHMPNEFRDFVSPEGEVRPRERFVPPDDFRSPEGFDTSQNFQNFTPPEGHNAPKEFQDFRPSEGVGMPQNFTQPEGFNTSQEFQNFTPPEGFDVPQDFQPPAEFMEGEPEPISSRNNLEKKSLLGSVIDAFLGLFR